MNEGDVIPAANSSEGKRLMAMGLANRPEQDDNINIIITRVGTLLGTLNSLLTDVQDAIVGSDESVLGRTLGDVEATIAGLRYTAERLPDDLLDTVDRLMEQIEPILKDVGGISEKLADPDGTVMAILGTEGEVYTGLASSLESVSGILQNLDKTSDFIPAQLPQLAVLLNDLHGALKAAEDVLIALTNNPLLKNGVPERKETRAGGTQARDIQF